MGTWASSVVRLKHILFELFQICNMFWISARSLVRSDLFRVGTNIRMNFCLQPLIRKSFEVMKITMGGQRSTITGQLCSTWLLNASLRRNIIQTNSRNEVWWQSRLNKFNCTVDSFQWFSLVSLSRATCFQLNEFEFDHKNRRQLLLNDRLAI